jgi:hypothetical protein
LKIPARRAEYSLTENVASPFQAEPRQQALHGIAVSQTEQVGVESGLKTTEQIQSESKYDMTLVDMAQVFGKPNELPQIYRVLSLIHSPYMKCRALIEAAEAMSGISTPD